MSDMPAGTAPFDAGLWRPEAVLFDLDGTLVDTEAVAIACNLRVFAALGHPVEAAFLHTLIGKDGPSSAALIQAALPELDMAVLERELQAAYQADLKAGLPMKSGARHLLAGLDLPLALVTSSGRASAWRKLDLVGIAGHFRQIITLEDVSAPKPDPAPYLLAAARLGLAPEACLVFEDSEIGAESAHRAGCRVVQVPDLIPASGRWAHLVAPDLLTGARLAGLRVSG